MTEAQFNEYCPTIGKVVITFGQHDIESTLVGFGRTLSSHQRTYYMMGAFVTSS
ncbi:MAG TPA: hypothetical protein VFY55_00610 [Nitrososphaeraceae archaeon]|nr:hypothetical protein [Nitrososphaeraceae archaeon]